MRILVVEDDALIALDVETMLSGMGHSVLGIAATSADARTMLDRATPDLVLLDINLGHGPDFDLARLLHGLAEHDHRCDGAVVRVFRLLVVVQQRQQ